MKLISPNLLENISLLKAKQATKTFRPPYILAIMKLLLLNSQYTLYENIFFYAITPQLAFLLS